MTSAGMEKLVMWKHTEELAKEGRKLGGVRSLK